MKRLVSAVLATLFGAQIATAQQTINGRITDGEAQPVEFANIILMAADSAFLGGTSRLRSPPTHIILISRASATSVS